MCAFRRWRLGRRHVVIWQRQIRLRYGVSTIARSLTLFFNEAPALTLRDRLNVFLPLTIYLALQLFTIDVMRPARIGGGRGSLSRDHPSPPDRSAAGEISTRERSD